MKPAEVVVAAYEAANQGHFSKASGFLAPEVRKALAKAHASTVASGKRLRTLLLRLKGRRGAVAAGDRKALRVLISSNKVLAAMHAGSPRFLGGLWKAATRGRSLVMIEVIRQVVRGPRARVYLRLTLRDGTVVRDSEPLVLHRGEWRLG